MRLSDVDRFNSRLGLGLFGLYSALYLGFVLLNALNPSVMEYRPVMDLNLAILYGFGLILAALVLAFIYGIGCRKDRSKQNQVEADSLDQQETEQ